MTIGEKVAYIKGLYSGLKIDETSDQGKVFGAILACLEEMASEVSMLTDMVDDLADHVCQIEENCDCDDYDCDCDDCCDCDDDDCDCGCDDEVFHGNLYEIICPTCSENITVDESTLEMGCINCPKCDEKLEFDLDDIEDGCDCGHHHH